MAKDIKTTSTKKTCEKCGAISVRSDKKYKVAMALIAVGSFGMAYAFFAPVSDIVYSILLLVLLAALLIGFPAIYLAKKKEYTCSKCKHKETIEKK